MSEARKAARAIGKELRRVTDEVAGQFAECDECFALVRAEREQAHQQWHAFQQDRWREMWTGERQ